MKKQTIAICLSQNIIKELKEKAKELGISVSSLIELILKGKFSL